MARFCLLFIPFFVVGVASTHASSPVELYWNKVLPNTPMPTAIKDLLASDSHVSPKLNAGLKKNPMVDASFHAGYAAATAAGYRFAPLLEENLRPGTKTINQFTKTTSGATFLSRQTANSIPFSSAKLSQILAHFAIDPNSIQAQSMKKTLLECEEPAMDDVSKSCTTSLESMVDYLTSTLQTSNVEAVSTILTTNNNGASKRQQYTITQAGVKRVLGSNFVACHARNYAYAVFYCHKPQAVRMYRVPLVGKDGTEVAAVAACHTVTAGAKPSPYLRSLNLNQGSSANICHILPRDHIVWIPKNYLRRD